MSDTQIDVRPRTVLDDESRHVARIYAEALYRAAEKGGQVEEVLGELEALVNDAFRQKPGLELFFSSAAVGREPKAAAIRTAFAGRASDVLVHFLEVLNEHDRLDLIRAVAGAYRASHDRKTRRVPVQVISAIPLTDAERDRLRGDIREVGGVEPILQETVDPEILGGLIVRVQDWVYDASVRTSLQTIRNQLIERSSYGIQGGRDRFGT